MPQGVANRCEANSENLTLCVPGVENSGGEADADMAILRDPHPAGGLFHGADSALRQRRVPVPHGVLYPDAQGETLHFFMARTLQFGNFVYLKNIAVFLGADSALRQCRAPVPHGVLHPDSQGETLHVFTALVFHFGNVVYLRNIGKHCSFQGVDVALRRKMSCTCTTRCPSSNSCLNVRKCVKQHVMHVIS